MAIYQLNAGKINGIDYSNNQPILTVSGNKITIRLLGDSFPFIEALLEEFIDGSGNPFATVAAFISYWNTYVGAKVITTPLSVVETPSITTLASSATVAAGARSVTIITNSDFVGTILGVNATADSVYTFAAQAGNTLGAIAITMSAGSATVLKTI